MVHEVPNQLDGLTSVEAAARLVTNGPNAIRSHRVRGWNVLARQFRNPVLVLLGSTALVTYFLGDSSNSVVILGILVMSVLLGFVTEYRAERATELLHSRVQHHVVVHRDGTTLSIPVIDLVIGDIVDVSLGTVVPADLRLLSVEDLECDESIISGESMAVTKSIEPSTSDEPFRNIARMGTIVTSGFGAGVVIATASETEFGRIAMRLGERQPETDFQQGLRRFSVFLVYVSVILTSLIFVANTILQRPLIESILFSLAIAIGMTPQLLPAVVSSSLAMGSRRMAKVGVLVKRLVSIEDLGDIDILITDKTGTLTSGHISFVRAIAAPNRNPLTTGLLATDTRFNRTATDIVGLNALDAALWARRDDVPDLNGATRLGVIPFSHDTRIVSSLVQLSSSERIVAVKGSAEDLAPLCTVMPPEITTALAEEYAKGSRVVLVASKAAGPSTTLKPEDLMGLTVDGLLIFSDEVKDNARASLDRLTKLGIAVKIATGDNIIVAKAVCAQLGLDVSDALAGSEIDGMDDETLRHRARSATIFARVSPEHKARIIEVLRGEGSAVGFMGDGVNDAIALHVSDVGISVDTATDVAKDAADIVLLKKDLGVLADGVLEGRRVFNNTMKYVFMGTSGDFGNMFSAAFGSIALNFLPMTPGQVLLNDVLYDSSQLAIPYDRVDPEAVTRPSHWNIAMIRRFMLTFGPISSIFDFATFALMILVFHAGEAEFQSGWFVESLATESLIVFVVRTRRVPFFRSLPSFGLIASVIAVVAVGCYLPYSPLAESIGFVALPAPFFLALLGMIVLYLVLVEFAKHLFFRRVDGAPVLPSQSHRAAAHRVGRRAARFSSSSVRHGSAQRR